MESKILENHLVWSAHRVKTLAQCERRYYFQHIGSWQGWDASSPLQSQCAYRLKWLTTPQLEIGNIVHNQIRVIFEKALSGWPILPAIEIQIAQEQFRDFITHSAQRHLEDLTAKQRKLFLHEMGKSLSADDMTKYEAWIEQLLEKFFGFSDVKQLLADPTPLLVEYLDPPGFKIGYELEVPARPRTDAVFIDPDNTVVVADWKSGVSSNDHRRLGLVYTELIARKMKLPPTRPVEVRFYYLATGAVEAFRFSLEERSEVLWQIGEEFASLQRMSDDPVINTGPESRFRPSVSRMCLSCNFHGMCEPFLRSKLARQQEVK